MMHSRRKEYDLLITGYIRTHLPTLLPIIPSAILNVLATFCNPSFYWHFKGNTLRDFLSMKPEEELESLPFHHNDLTFQCSISPNGVDENYKGWVNYFVELIAIPNNIYSVTFRVELCCQQTNSRFIQSCSVNHKQIEEGYGIGWLGHTLALNDCMQYNILTFICRITMLKIQYMKNNIFDGYYFKPKVIMKFPLIYNETFNPMKKLFAREKNKDSFFQSTFPELEYYADYKEDDCMVFFINTKQDTTYNSWKCGFKTIQLPPNIDCIDGKLILMISDNKSSDYFKREVNVRICYNWHCSMNVSASFLKTDKLSISARLFITCVHHVKEEVDDIIPCQQWAEYGIYQHDEKCNKYV